MWTLILRVFTQPFFITGQLRDLPGHFFLMKWSRQYGAPLVRPWLGHSGSFPLPLPVAGLFLPLEFPLGFTHWDWEGDHDGVLPRDFEGLDGERALLFDH